MVPECTQQCSTEAEFPGMIITCLPLNDCLSGIKAHSVPLDIKFFFHTPNANSGTSLPPAWTGDAFVTFHGSFDREPPTGYGVVRYTSRILSLYMSVAHIVGIAGSLSRT